MKTDLNTLLTNRYVHLDDRIMPAVGFSRDHHPGRTPTLNYVELLCLKLPRRSSATTAT